MTGGRAGEEEEGSALHRWACGGCRGHQGPLTGLTQQLWLLVGQDLVEDVVVPLSLQLENHPGLLQEIWSRGGGGEQVGRKRANQRKGGGQGRKALMASGERQGKTRFKGKRMIKSRGKCRQRQETEGKCPQKMAPSGE